MVKRKHKVGRVLRRTAVALRFKTSFLFPCSQVKQYTLGASFLLKDMCFLSPTTFWHWKMMGRFTGFRWATMPSSLESEIFHPQVFEVERLNCQCCLNTEASQFSSLLMFSHYNLGRKPPSQRGNWIFHIWSLPSDLLLTRLEASVKNPFSMVLVIVSSNFWHLSLWDWINQAMFMSGSSKNELTFLTWILWVPTPTSECHNLRSRMR